MTIPCSVSTLRQAEAAREAVSVAGWVRTKRDAKNFSFLELNDGSCLGNLQIIVDSTLDDFDQVRQLNTGAALRVSGALVASPGKGQAWELKAQSVIILGTAPADYPLQKKRHSDEFLRTIAHLRPRTNKYGALFRIRSRLAHAIHGFFQERGFHWIHTPIITAADCEGAGEMFQVTTMNLADIPITDGKIDYDQDFFARQASLTVSGQLAVEPYCLSLGKVYTFGPTFRAENSNTARHIAEFWMIEPEIAFADLTDAMQLGEGLVRYLAGFMLHECADDLALFSQFVDKTLLARLQTISEREFIRLPYTEALDILKQSGQRFEYAIDWGRDLQAEHERFLTEQHFKQPVIVYDYPKEIKAFYMRANDDGRTVASMDILLPVIGELIGGSQREERYTVLQQRLAESGLAEKDYGWYLDTRRYGTAPHAGFGLGFERLLMLFTGISNIRDVIPYPRTPRHLEF